MYMAICLCSIVETGQGFDQVGAGWAGTLYRKESTATLLCRANKQVKGLINHVKLTAVAEFRLHILYFITTAASLKKQCYNIYQDSNAAPGSERDHSLLRSSRSRWQTNGCATHVRVCVSLPDCCCCVRTTARPQKISTTRHRNFF